MPAIPVFPEGDYGGLSEAPGPGFVADGVPSTIVTYTAEAAIGFGLAVQRGTVAGSCVQGITGTAASAPTGFLGIAVRNPAAANAANDAYQVGDNVPVLIEGTIFVTNADSAASAVGGRLALDPTAGTGAILTDVAAGCPVAGAQFQDVAAQSALARVRFIGSQQA